jgi:hypothetical protein
MKWLKSAGIGVLGSIVMFALMMLGIHVTGIAPFNLPPSAAFLESIRLNIGPLALMTHLGYGASWSIILLALYKNQVSTKNGIILASLLWLFMMIVYSPIIGWGFFGFGKVSTLDPSASLYLESGPKYLIMTLVLHLIYGGIIGWGNASWVTYNGAS